MIIHRISECFLTKTTRESGKETDRQTADTRRQNFHIGCTHANSHERIIHDHSHEHSRIKKTEYTNGRTSFLHKARGGRGSVSQAEVQLATFDVLSSISELALLSLLLVNSLVQCGSYHFCCASNSTSTVDYWYQDGRVDCTRQWL
jgi:hypothetical protein